MEAEIVLQELRWRLFVVIWIEMIYIFCAVKRMNTTHVLLNLCCKLVGKGYINIFLLWCCNGMCGRRCANNIVFGIEKNGVRKVDFWRFYDFRRTHFERWKKRKRFLICVYCKESSEFEKSVVGIMA